MLKFLLLVLAFNLIGFFLERMKRNAQKKKQMEYDEGRESVPEESYEEEPPTPPVVSTPDDILGDFFKKLETSTTQKQQPAPQEREESLEEPAFGRVPSYKEYDAREYNAKEYEAKEYEAKEYEVKGHAKMQDGRSLIELMESKQQNKYDKYSGFDSHSNEPVLGAMAVLAQPAGVAAVYKDLTAAKVKQPGRTRIRVNLRDGIILKEILGAPRALQPWSH